ncbi:MAG: hypothetical protein JO000_12890 [Alphaproteobacteria bacterium]|nr:hypothetical protein [Alphaproteobacteria bacterium]
MPGSSSADAATKIGTAISTLIVLFIVADIAVDVVHALIGWQFRFFKCERAGRSLLRPARVPLRR